jgi:hypothetical protein
MTVKVNDVYTVNDANWRCIPIPLNLARVAGIAKPTIVTDGVFSGFSLPVFNNDDEELFAFECIPEDWDGLTNFQFILDGWLDTENTNKRFKTQLAAEVSLTGSILPSSPIITEEETLVTGTIAAKTFYKILYSVDGQSATWANGNALSARVRRIAASQDEIAGEFVVRGLFLRYKLNRAGSPS